MLLPWGCGLDVSSKSWNIIVKVGSVLRILESIVAK
jgi:hypothetical protein